jgi:hypothetical protein
VETVRGANGRVDGMGGLTNGGRAMAVREVESEVWFGLTRVTVKIHGAAGAAQ